MTHKSTSWVKSIFQNSQAHRRTGLEILEGGKHESARLALKARKPLEGSGGMLPGKILKTESL